MEELLFGWLYKPTYALTLMEEITIICEFTIAFGLLYILNCIVVALRRNKKIEERKRYKYYNQARKEGRKRGKKNV